MYPKTPIKITRIIMTPDMTITAIGGAEVPEMAADLFKGISEMTM